MSWLSRLVRAEKPAPEPPPPPPHTVVIPDDLVVELTGSGQDLGEAVVATLHAHREAQIKAAEALARGERIPFWLQRDPAERGDIEDELRDRVTARRAGENEAAATSRAAAATTVDPT